MKMVSFTPRPLYSRGERRFSSILLIPIHGLDVSEETYPLPLLGITF